MGEMVRVDPERAELQPIGGKNQPSFAISNTWTPDGVRRALDENDAGLFSLISLLSSHVTRHPDFIAARRQRVSTPIGMDFELELPSGYESGDARSPAARIRDRAKPMIEAQTTAGLDAYIIGELADFGMAHAVMHWEPTGDGSAWRPVIQPWPHEAVEIDSNGDRIALLKDGGREKITPGDGRWIEVLASLKRPHELGAIRALAAQFLAVAHADRDASRFSEAAGQNPVIATRSKEQGYDQTADQTGLITAAQNISKGYQGATISPGQTIARLNSNAGQIKIFEYLCTLGASRIAKVYLGQDGTIATGTTGTYGARQVLQSVAFRLAKEDALALHQAYKQILVPWAFYNFARPDLAPFAVWEVPDADEEAREAAEGLETRQNRLAFLNEIERLKNGGAALTLELAAEIADAYDLECSDAYLQMIVQKNVDNTKGNATEPGTNGRSDD